MTIKNEIEILDIEEEIISIDGNNEELGVLEFEDIEDEEEDENMWHRLVTSNPDIDWDWDYFFNEKYFE